MKNIEITCTVNTSFKKEIIINDKNMSDKQLKEIITEAQENFTDEIKTDLYYIGKLKIDLFYVGKRKNPYETISSEIQTICSKERKFKNEAN